MHILPIAHDGDAGQLFGRALREEADGGGHVLQIDSGIQQSLETARITTSLNEYNLREPDPCDGVMDGSTICLRAQ